MKYILKRIGILTVIFIAAVLLWFFGNREERGQGEPDYVSMAEAKLPVLYAKMFGEKRNRMVGYCQEMETSTADSLTILPTDRRLELYVEYGTDEILGASYEIRSMDRERLVEQTTLDEWKTEADDILLTLPIQNLLTKDREYLLRVNIHTKTHGIVYYYTRILLTENEAVQSMLELATDFSTRTFDYEAARELTMYLETDASETDQSFDRTTIHSSYKQLTWGALDMEPLGEVQVTLKELDGVMCSVQLSYLATRMDEMTNREVYEVEENFTLKWNSIRTYLMAYERTVNEIFDGEQGDYNGKRILLGITNEEKPEVVRSVNGTVYAFRANRDLWIYKQEAKERRAVKVFSFRSSQEQDTRNNYNQHDTKILQVEDDGSIDFLVYGYMNRGGHEGWMGITAYHYSASANALEELFFIPYTGTYEQLAQDLNNLTYQNQSDHLYLYLDHAIYGIDLKSREIMIVADALTEDSYAVSEDKQRIAWQEGRSIYEADTIHLMDLETGVNQKLQGNEQEYVRVLGFVGRDLVYGVAGTEDHWIINGRTEELPMHTIYIVNDALEVETSYTKQGYYISDVVVEESRIHLTRMEKIAAHSYASAQDDTIVCNAEIENGNLKGIGWYTSEKKERVYFVQLDQEIGNGKTVKVQVPKQISYEHSEVLSLKSNHTVFEEQFFAYGGGHLLKVTSDFTEALQLAYDKMGFVTDVHHRTLWNRVNRGTQKTIKDPMTAFAGISSHLEEFTGSKAYSDGMILLDCRGCSMMQILYFVDQGIPVMAYSGEGEYRLISGFDQYNVTLHDPETGETYKAGLNDSTEQFRQQGNDFIAAVKFP